MKTASETTRTSKGIGPDTGSRQSPRGSNGAHRDNNRRTGSGMNSVEFEGDEFEDLTTVAQAAGLNVKDYLLGLHRCRGSGSNGGDPYDTDAHAPVEAVYRSDLGTIFRGDSRELMGNGLEHQSVDLVMTSPPYALVYKKDYGNEDADRYLDWFRSFMAGFNRVLKPNGSLVIDIGGVWKRGRPTRSLYHFELLVMLCREYGYHLCQEFYWWNPAKLPGPAEWVNVRRIRVKDAVNCIWWLSKSPYPKSSNRRVLQPYSRDMDRLLKNGYRHKIRPSGHNISAKFNRHNEGAIPPNLIALANNDSNSAYRRYCQENDIAEHPAQYPRGIPGFFIRMLTDPGDLVFDPFAGSCVTGEVAESMGRSWACCEIRPDYVEAGKGRFACGEPPPDISDAIRTLPYEVYAPRLDLVAEEDAPLPNDGGAKSRRKKKEP